MKNPGMVIPDGPGTRRDLERSGPPLRRAGLGGVVLWIATVNVFNRVNVATRQIPGQYPG
jgi:hypothetical protein